MAKHRPGQKASGITTVVVSVLTGTAAGVAALEVYAIVDGFGSQPNNCYVEDSTKVGVLDVFGSIVVVIALAAVAVDARAIVKGRPSVGRSWERSPQRWRPSQCGRST